MPAITWKEVGDATGYALWDTPGELLRSLSAEYLAASFVKLATHVRSLGADPGDLRFGWLHPGVADLPSGRESPLSYLGWLWNDRRPAVSEREEAERAAVLLVETPRLRWGGSYRAGTYACDPTNGVEMLQAMRDYVADDVTAGDPAWLARGAGGDELIDAIVAATMAHDRLAVSRLLERAQATYSPAGADLLRLSLLQWLDAGH